MSNRTLRVNELILRELGDILRKRYQDEASAITIIGVEVTPDIREGKAFVAVTGDEEQTRDAMRWLRRQAQAIRFELGRRIVLKHMPVLAYELDTSTERGNRILGLLDELEREEKQRASESGPNPQSSAQADSAAE